MMRINHHLKKIKNKEGDSIKNKNALIIFTKIPIPGFTKTRMQSHISEEESKILHINILKDLSDQIKGVDAKVFVFFTGEYNKQLLESIFKEAVFLQQCNGTIWEKMNDSINRVYDRGYKNIILIGSDIPQLDSYHINNMFLNLKDNNIVLSPTYDEGYCLIGMDKPYNEVFDVDNYSSKNPGKSVFKITLELSNNRSRKVYVSNSFLDLDTFEDIISLCNIDGLMCGNTLNYSKKLIKKYGGSQDAIKTWKRKNN